jgi:outer membrane protein OmpA-like peptidoglycan-associated protein
VSPPRPPTPPRAESSAPTPSAPVVPAAAPALLPGRIAMLRFAKGQSDIPTDGRDVLTGIAARLAANPGMRLQLVAYASGGSGDDPIEARRLSLTRAVALRTYLIGQGVPSVRMDVRALGSRGAGDGPADRVDLVVVER